MNPNVFAEIALFAWVPIALLFFRSLRPAAAVAVALLGSILLLPANVGIHFPGLPAMDRHVSGGLAALIGYFVLVPRSAKGPRRIGWDTAVIAVLVFCTFLSAITNPDPLQYGILRLPGLTAYDSLGLIFGRFVAIGLPFYMATRLVRGTEDVIAVLKVVVGFGLVYVPFVFWEARMSPQLHATLYGYFPHDFQEHVRGGRYRPVVFTGSGLECATFLATAVLASIGLHRVRARVFGIPTVVTSIALFMALVACVSLAPFLYGFLITLLMLATRERIQAQVAIVLSIIVVFYPLLRSQDLFPTSAFVSAAEIVSADRANSLAFRFDNEDQLLAKAAERPLFGWGSWSRNHVYDRETGDDISVTDGFWIIELGQFGLLGFLSFFGLLLTPAILVARRMKRMPPGLARGLIACVMLIVIVRAVDLIPNGFLSAITLYFSGMLMPFARPVAKRASARTVPARREALVPPLVPPLVPIDQR